MRPVGVILLIIGVVMGGAGGYALAEHVRSGDWVIGGSAVVNTHGERVVVSQYGETSFDTDIRLTARSQTGAVFVGTANPIDVSDYTADVAHSTITSVAPLSGIKTATVPGASKDLAAEPVGLDFWLDHVYGAGSQSLLLAEGDTPSQLVVIAPADSAITLRIDYHEPGIRGIVYGVIGIGGGLALLGLALLLVGTIRVRRRPSATPAPPVGPPTRPLAPLMRWASALIALTMISATSGCSLPRLPAHAQAAAQAEITKVPLSKEKSTRVAEDLNRRLGAAYAHALAPAYSTDGWKDAYSELALESTTFETLLEKADGGQQAPLSCTIVIDEVYGSDVTAYPMATTVLVSWWCGAGRAEKVFMVLSRAHSYSPWFITASARLLEALPPAPGQGVVTGAEKDAGSAAIAALVTYVNTGTIGAVEPPAALKAAYAAVAAASGTDKVTMTAKAANPDTTTYPSSLHTSRTGSGTVTTSSFVVTETSTAPPGYTIHWVAPVDQIFVNQAGEHKTLSRRFAGTASVLTENNRTSVVGWSMSPIL